MENSLSLLWEDNPGIFLLLFFILLVGALAKWKMFEKADQPGLAAIIPIYDLVITMRIVGRPDSHAWLFIIPGFNIYFGFRILIELVQSFGKYSILDYALATVFNMFYALNLGLAYNEVYYGPVYGHKLSELKARPTPQYA
jgi:hypothetical protein